MRRKRWKSLSLADKLRRAAISPKYARGGESVVKVERGPWLFLTMVFFFLVNLLAVCWLSLEHS
jgi:hypothetical protein